MYEKISKFLKTGLGQFLSIKTAKEIFNEINNRLMRLEQNDLEIKTTARHWLLVTGETDQISKGLKNLANSNLPLGPMGSANISVSNGGYQIAAHATDLSYYRTPIPMYDLYQQRTIVIGFKLWIPATFNALEADRFYLLSDLYTDQAGMAIRLVDDGKLSISIRTKNSTTALAGITNIPKLVRGQWNELLIAIDTVSGDLSCYRTDNVPFRTWVPNLQRNGLDDRAPAVNRMYLGSSLFTSAGTWEHQVDYLAISSTNVPLHELELGAIFKTMCKEHKLEF